MFTVLVRNKSSNNESLYLVDLVEYIYTKNEDSDAGIVLRWNSGEAAHLAMSNSTDAICDVYVMNPEGQTVARYVL